MDYVNDDPENLRTHLRILSADEKKVVSDVLKGMSPEELFKIYYN